MRRILGQPNLLLLLGGSVVSSLGDWALALALPYFVFDRTGSILSTGGLVAAELLPRLLFSSLAGVLADRWNRRLTMIGSDLFRAALVPVLLLVATGGPLWLVYAVAMLEACAAQLFVPASGALLPSVVRSRDDLYAANSALTGARAATQLVGPPLGGLLYTALGLGTSALVDGASFVVSALAIAAMRSLAPAPPPDAGAPEPGGGLLADLAAGLRFVAGHRRVAAVCLSIGVVMIGQGTLETAIVPFLRGVLRFDATEFGVVAAAQGAGSLIGAFGLGSISARLTGSRVLGACLLLAGGLLAGFALSRSLPLTAGFLLLASVPVVVATVWVQTYYQRHVDDRLLGRVLGLGDNLAAVGLLIGIAGSSLLGASVGAGTLMLAAGGVLAVAGAGALAALWTERPVAAAPAGPVAAGVDGE